MSSCKVTLQRVCIEGATGAIIAIDLLWLLKPSKSIQDVIIQDLEMLQVQCVFLLHFINSSLLGCMVPVKTGHCKTSNQKICPTVKPLQGLRQKGISCEHSGTLFGLNHKRPLLLNSVGPGKEREMGASSRARHMPPLCHFRLRASLTV